jgi:hypothetical protein
MGDWTSFLATERIRQQVYLPLSRVFEGGATLASIVFLSTSTKQFNTKQSILTEKMDMRAIAGEIAKALS